MQSRARGGILQWLWLAGLLGLGSVVTAQDVGFAGPGMAGVGPTVGLPEPTASKPEDKLWFNDHSWWGSLWSAGSQAFHIHRLNALTHTWVDTGVEVDARPDSHGDALWDGTKLYIATHEFSHGPGGDPGDPQLLLRYSYAAGTYTLDPGFPVAIGDVATETMVIEKDSTGTMWAVWKQNLRVFYSHTEGSDTAWSAPAVLPSCTSDFDSDDICSIIRFNGNRIGVMWSDRVQNAFLFARHVDGDPGTSWTPAEFVLREWDDHINLAADSAGRVFAAIKNSAEEVKLLVRGVGGVGGWQQYMVGDRTAALTRPIVLLNEVGRTVHVFATSGGTIQEKASSLDTIAFPPGAGTIVIRDADAAVNNATSSKQNVTPSTGIVVLAANTSTAGTYWHHEFQVPVEPEEDGLVLGPILPGTAGVINEFRVTGATPGRLVGIMAGFRVGSSVISLVQCPDGVPIEVAAPYTRLPLVRPNGAGVATLRFLVPANVAGINIQLQAVEAFSCRASNRVAERF